MARGSSSLRRAAVVSPIVARASLLDVWLSTSVLFLLRIVVPLCSFGLVGLPEVGLVIWLLLESSCLAATLRVKVVYDGNAVEYVSRLWRHSFEGPVRTRDRVSWLSIYPNESLQVFNGRRWITIVGSSGFWSGRAELMHEIFEDLKLRKR